MRSYVQHGRRHTPNGSDPIDGYIAFDTDNVGDWLLIDTTDGSVVTRFYFDWESFSVRQLSPGSGDPSFWGMYFDPTVFEVTLAEVGGLTTDFSFSADEFRFKIKNDQFINYTYGTGLDLEPADDLYFSPGGNIICESLPTSDPAVTGALWNDSGAVRVSYSDGGVGGGIIDGGGA